MNQNSSTCKNVDPWKSRGAGRSLGAGNRCLDLWEAVQGCMQSLQFTGFAVHLPWVNLQVWSGYDSWRNLQVQGGYDFTINSQSGWKWQS